VPEYEKPLISSTSGQRLSHPHCDHEARKGGEGTDSDYRRLKSEQVGDAAGSKVVRLVTTAPVAITSSKTSPLTPAKRLETWTASAPLQYGSPDRHYVE
jgi:hypothetical protein